MAAPTREAGTPGGGDGTTSIAREPIARAGHWSWQASAGTARCLFFGKPVEGSAEQDVLAELERSGLEVAILRQTHSRRVLEARPGDCGEGDALVSAHAGLALRVVTADCVPVLLASATRIAAVHAGWRGLRAGIVGAAARRLGADGACAAVIGPAIGGCCYEVGGDVAEEVAEEVGSRSVILRPGDGPRPHLDLRLAARLALEQAGVEAITTIEACTRCDSSRLWSYRRDGRGAGRNLAFVWREP
ncbi:MAG TPA: polyphenol oxidase family protein [Thermoanaerobaculia bacterium]|nr:polyphenol oxidase family protein [Thermoanaerobaculia bacterium]